MASYSYNIVDNGSGSFTATAFRNPTTAASGGTAIAGAGDSLLATATNDIKHVLQALSTVTNDDRAANG